MVYQMLSQQIGKKTSKIRMSEVATSEVVPSLLLPSTKVAYSTILGKSYSVPKAESKILITASLQQHPKCLYASISNFERTKVNNFPV